MAKILDVIAASITWASYALIAVFPFGCTVMILGPKDGAKFILVLVGMGSIFVILGWAQDRHTKRKQEQRRSESFSKDWEH